jgi:hypothetical protein
MIRKVGLGTRFCEEGWSEILDKLGDDLMKARESSIY